MHQILIVEDSEVCRHIISKALEGPELNFHLASTLEEATSFLRRQSFDLVILDLRLPDGESFCLFDSFKKQLSEIPTLVISGLCDLESKLKAFDLGAADYITKPIQPRELRARVDMQLRKVSRVKATSPLLQKGSLKINIPMLRASVTNAQGETELDLTGKEFKILCFLAQNENKCFTRQELVNAVWGDSVHVLDRTVDSHVCGLRRKLGHQSRCIESVPNKGYKFSQHSEANSMLMRTS